METVSTRERPGCWTRERCIVVRAMRLEWTRRRAAGAARRVCHVALSTGATQCTQCCPTLETNVAPVVGDTRGKLLVLREEIVTRTLGKEFEGKVWIFQNKRHWHLSPATRLDTAPRLDCRPYRHEIVPQAHQQGLVFLVTLDERRLNEMQS